MVEVVVDHQEKLQIFAAIVGVVGYSHSDLVC